MGSVGLRGGGVSEVVVSDVNPSCDLVSTRCWFRLCGVSAYQRCPGFPLFLAHSDSSVCVDARCAKKLLSPGYFVSTREVFICPLNSSCCILILVRAVVHMDIDSMREFESRSRFRRSTRTDSVLVSSLCCLFVRV